MDYQKIESIGTCLGVAFKENTGRYSASLLNKELGIKARLEIIPAANVVRLYQDRAKSGKPSFVGRYELHSVESFVMDSGNGQVRFKAGAATLIVSKSATAVLSYASEEPLDLPEEVEEIEHVLSGTIARPDHKRVKDGTISLWTAGLGVKTDGQDKMRWMNLIAWRAIADRAANFEAGASVKVKGVFKTEEWTDKEGEIHTKDILVLAGIEAV